MTMTLNYVASFNQKLLTVLSVAEGLSPQPMNVGDNTVTYGYGYTFIRKRGTSARR